MGTVGYTENGFAYANDALIFTLNQNEAKGISKRIWWKDGQQLRLQIIHAVLQDSSL